MHNRSEFVASQQLEATVKRYNTSISKYNTKVSTIAWFILIFGAIGFMLSIAYFA